jgi:hypothetical protein
MKKIFLSLAIMALLAGCIDSGKKADTTSVVDSVATTKATVNPDDAAVFEFDQMSYDFGKITDGESVTYDFKFKNVGKSPLIITDATATCGCTKPEFPKTPIAPNESGIIHVTFNSAGKNGMQNKIITITSNTIPPLTELHLLGEVKTK